MPLSTFLRLQALRRRPLPADRVPAVNLRTVGELQRIGNNLNQAVHLIHTGTIPPSFGEILRRLLAEIRAFHQSLIEHRASSPDR